MKIRTLLSIAVLLAARGALAGGQQIAVEVAPDKGSLLVRTYRCGTPPEIVVSGTAEGIVNGARRNLELRITRTPQAGVFRVERQWPGEGAWVLTFSAQGQAFVNALVELAPGPTLAIASQQSTYKKFAARDVESALKRRAGN